MADSAEVIGRVTLGRNASIWPMAVLRGDVEPIVIGDESNIQDGCVVHTRENHPTLVGKGVVVGHSAILHGCRIGNHCLIGMGAVVQEVAIADNCLIAAGAVLVPGFAAPKGSLVMGIPGRVIRKLRKNELAQLRQGAKDYLKYTRQHLKTREKS